MKETLAFYVAALYRDFLAYTTERLRELGLSFGQLPLIIYTGKHPDCTQADLTRELRLDWGYSQRSVAKLSDSGFLIKKYDDERACNCLRLTKKGTEAFDVSHQVFRSWDETRMKDFSPEEKKLIISLLSKITAGEKAVPYESI